MIDPELKKILKKPVDLPKLLADLDFSDEQIVDVSKQQPQLFMEAVRFRVQAMRERTICDAKVAGTKASKGAKFRAKGKELGERVTEGQVSEKLDRDPEVIVLQAELDEAEQAEEWAKLLLEAFRMRRDATKVVADVIGAEIYVSKLQTGAQTELKKIKGKLESKYPGGKR